MKTYRIKRSQISSNGYGKYYALVDTADGLLNVHFDENMEVTYTAIVSSDMFADDSDQGTFKEISANIVIV